MTTLIKTIIFHRIFENIDSNTGKFRDSQIKIIMLSNDSIIYSSGLVIMFEAFQYSIVIYHYVENNP